jgi:maleylacetoacetate isomerase
MKLYGYWRSSASWRVRIALHWKRLAHDCVPVHLRRGEQRGAEYLELNPQGLIPTLVDDSLVLGQSLAIIEYLEERWPEPPLLPRDAAGRARVRQLALVIAADTHPLQNLGTLRLLESELGVAAEGQQRFVRSVIRRGLAAFEKLLESGPAGGSYCHGAAPSLADVCLVPQVYNARRFGLDVEGEFPRLARIERSCLELPAFSATAPELQPDAESQQP